MDRRFPPTWAAQPEKAAAHSRISLLATELNDPREFSERAAAVLGSALDAACSIVITGATPKKPDAIPPRERGNFVAVPIDTPAGQRGVIAIARASDRGPLKPEELDFVRDAAGVIGLKLAYATLLEQQAGAAPAELEDLTPRERDVLGLIGEGHTNREIARELVLSVRTIEWHRARIKQKLGAASRAELHRAARALSMKPATGAAAQ